MDALRHFAHPPVPKPVNHVLPNREHEMTKTHGGGYAFEIDCFAQLRRFLIIGTDGGTYYQTEQKITEQNVKNVKRAIETDGVKTVAIIQHVSSSGVAHRNVYAVYALAMCAAAKDVVTRQAAGNALQTVCRTGTDVFMYVNFLMNMRGKGATFKKPLQRLLQEREVDVLALHAIKYKQREGMSWRDLLRLVKPKTTDSARNAVFKFMTTGEVTPEAPRILQVYSITSMADVSIDTVLHAIKDDRMPWEALSDELRADKRIWATLAETMPAVALTRQLPTITRRGLLSPFSQTEKVIVERFNDESYIKRSHAHPMQFFLAAHTYRQGGAGGKSRGEAYTPSLPVVDALGKAFYHAFQTVEPSGKNVYLALDISGSMWTNKSSDGISAAAKAGAMALITAKTENTHAVAFTTNGVTGRYRGGEGFVEPISLGSTLEQVDHTMKELSHRMGGTDLSLPMLDALKKRIPIDIFHVYTDNETTWHGIHPSEALAKYNREMGRNAKLAVIAMTATNFSIADPRNPLMMDFVGFDAAAPKILADFAADRL
jgi:60 kDa SS-A/Ro ribonucleoprotein